MTKTASQKKRAAQKRTQSKAKNPPKQPKAKKAKKMKKGSGMNTAVATNLGRTSIGHTHKESGSDLLYTVATNGTPPTAATVLASVLINPLTIVPDGRLAQFAPLFNKFRFTKLRVYYQNDAAQTFSGQTMSWFTSNPEQEFTDAGVRLNQVVKAQTVGKFVPLCKFGGYTVPSANLQNAKGGKFLIDVEDSDDKFDCYTGQIFFAVDGPLVANTTYGNWFVDWEVVFYDPCINTPPNAQFSWFTTGTWGQSSPWGQAITEILAGADDLVTVTYDGSHSVMTFPRVGNYLIHAYYTGTGSGLTSSSTMNITGGAITGSYIAYTNAQTGKFWSVVVTVATPNAQLLVNDTAGTHPSTGSLQMTVTRYTDGTLLTKSERRDKIFNETKSELEDKVAKLEELLKSVGICLPTKQKPSFPNIHSGMVAPPGEMTSTYSYTIQDGNNNPPMTVTGSSTTEVGILDVAVVAPSEKKERKREKKKKHKDYSSDSDF